MKKLFKVLEEILMYALALMTISVVVLGFYQVLARYVLRWSIGWTEETMRYIFCGIIFLGIGVVVKEETLVTITFVSDAIKKRSKIAFRILKCFHFLIQSVFFVLLFYLYYVLMVKGSKQYSAMAHINFSIIYFPGVVGAAVSSVQSLIKLVRMIIVGPEEAAAAPPAENAEIA